MSYDLHLLPRPPGADVLGAARARLQQDEAEINPGPPVPVKEANKRRLAAALMEENPRLSVFEFDYVSIAAQRGVTAEEARRSHRHLELNGPEDGPGIQITLLDDTAAITVPYWHGPRVAAAVFDEIWRYLALLERHGGFAVYDPQLDRVLSLAADRPAVIERYGAVMKQMAPTSGPTAMPGRPWWKFW